MPRRVCSVEASVGLAICGEGIWITKGAKSRERHETSHLVNGIEVGDSVVRVPGCVFRGVTFHAARFMVWAGSGISPKRET